jgi:hypothetical protein
MITQNSKTLLFIVWVCMVGGAAFAMGVTSVPIWLVVASVAVVPPLVVRNFWRAPDQTMSESINQARR